MKLIGLSASAVVLVAVAWAATAAAAGPQAAPLVTKGSLSLEGAKQVLAAASAEAKRQAAGGVIAVVDDGGHLVCLERLDGTFPAGAEVSIGKARTAALFKRPTKAFEDIIAKGRTAMVTIEGFTPLQGGIPIVVDGQVVGAIGVSGAASAQADEEIALAGASALKTLPGAQTVGAAMPLPAAVTHIGAVEVTAAFAKGQPLLEVPGYKVHASRRDAPGMAEVHDTDTDVIYVVDGSATLVTGGEVVDGKSTAAGEVRGASIRGGVPRRIAKGDFLVVPSGVPHWFQEVPGPLTYYVVKVPAAAGGAR